MDVKVRIGDSESFIDVDIDENRNGKFRSVAAEEANRLLTRADVVDESTENRPCDSFGSKNRIALCEMVSPGTDAKQFLIVQLSTSIRFAACGH